MPVLPDADKRFFLTRQSANIMVDLSRQLAQPQTVNLLYGRSGVGKSRLLGEFISSRTNARPVTCLRFAEGGECRRIDEFGKESSPPFVFSTDTLRQIKVDSLLVIDQFEFAPSEVKRQILEFWDKNANQLRAKLIVCGRPRLVTDLRELALPESVSINSVELLPLSGDESFQYASSRICPHAGTSIHLTRKLTSRLKAAQGLFRDIDKFIAQNAAQIDCMAEQSLVNRRSVYLPVFMLLLVTLVVVFTLYPFDNTRNGYDDQPSIPPSVEQSKPAPKSYRGQSDDIGKAYSALNSRPEAEVRHEKAESLENHRAAVDTSGQTLTEHLHTLVPSPVPGPESRRFSVELEIPSTSNLLEQRLSATRQWLAGENDQAASIQVLTLFSSVNPDSSLLRYLNRLETAGVDLDQVFVYRSSKQQSTLHGVLFGTFAGRTQALRQIKQLPAILRENDPIPRTIGGIRREINQ